MLVDVRLRAYAPSRPKEDLFTLTVLLGLVRLTVPRLLVRAFLVSYLFSNRVDVSITVASETTRHAPGAVWRAGGDEL